MANQGMDTEVLLLINFFRGRLFTFNQREFWEKLTGYYSHETGLVDQFGESQPYGMILDR